MPPWFETPTEGNEKGQICPKGSCSHQDCLARHKLIDSKCRICTAVIGQRARVYFEGGSRLTPVHGECMENDLLRLDNETKMAKARKEKDEKAALEAASDRGGLEGDIPDGDKPPGSGESGAGGPENADSGGMTSKNIFKNRQ